MTAIKETITKRIDPCNCGCGGTDPWHKRNFKRVIKDIQDCEEAEGLMTTGTTHKYDKVGFAQMPWGKQRVVRVIMYVKTMYHGNRHELGWYILKEDFYKAIN